MLLGLLMLLTFIQSESLQLPVSFDAQDAPEIQRPAGQSLQNQGRLASPPALKSLATERPSTLKGTQGRAVF